MNIDSIFKNISFEEFSSKIWGAQNFHFEIPNSDISNLINWHDIDLLLQEPFIYQKVPILLRSTSFELNEPSPKCYEDIIKGLKNGYTLQIRHLQDIFPSNMPFMKFVRGLEKLLLHPLDSITVFHSLPGSFPTAIHKDISEIFSFQISGKKKWRIAKNKCLTSQMSYTENEFKNWNEYILTPGQFLYLPSHLPHQVQCIEEASTSFALVFKSIQFESLLWILKEIPQVKDALLKPLPIMGYKEGTEQSKQKIDNFLKLIQKNLSELKSEDLLNDISKDMYHFIMTAIP